MDTKADVAIIVSDHCAEVLEVNADDPSQERFFYTESSFDEDHPPSMSFYMLCKTYQWFSRGKVAAWFAAAFGLKDDDDDARILAEVEKNPHVRGLLERRRAQRGDRPATPRVFYELPRRDTRLTLDFEAYSAKNSPLHRPKSVQLQEPINNSLEKAKKHGRYSPEQFSEWMRSSSGFFSEDQLMRVHDTQMKDTIRLCSSTSDLEIKIPKFK